eukprot:gene33993-22870_t
MAACEGDTNCGWVYDSRCDDAGPHGLCPSDWVAFQSGRTIALAHQRSSQHLAGYRSPYRFPYV